MRAAFRALRLIGLALLAAAPALAQAPGSTPVTNAFGDPASSWAHILRHTSYVGFWIMFPLIAIAEVLLVYVIFKFRRKPGRKAATFHENPALEIFWTVVPLFAVLVVGYLSHQPLHFYDSTPAPDLNVMVVGHRFFWEYRYPDYGIDFANKDLVVPAGRNVDLQITSVDVIHGFYVPSLGVQMDAVPGRITHAWFNAKAGHYEGQCAQLCGPLHGEMWINVDVVPPAEFAAWLKANANPAPSAQPAAPAAKPAAPSARMAAPAGRPSRAKETL